MPRPSRSVRMKSFRSSAGSPKNFVAALVLQHQQLALDGADGLLRDVAVLRGAAPSACSAMNAEHRAQVLEVEQQQPLLVGDAEGDVEHAFLHVVEVQQPRQQQRPHLGDGGADRMALLAEQIPEHHRKFVRLVVEAQLLGALDERLLGLADRGDAGEVALDVGGEHRDAGARRSLRPAPAASRSCRCRSRR